MWERSTHQECSVCVGKLKYTRRTIFASSGDSGSKLVSIEIFKTCSQLYEEKFSSTHVKYLVAFKFGDYALSLGNNLAFLTNEGVIYHFLLQKFSEA